MPGDSESFDDVPAGGPRPSRRRPLVVAAVGLLCLLAAGGGLFAFLRGGDGDGGGDAITEVTFGPEGDATSIPERPAIYGSIMELSVGSGPAGSEVILQGANFKADEGLRKIELYWDRVGGLKLGTVEAPRFSVKVKIPADARAVDEGHFIIAVQRNKDGEVVTEQSAQFHVLPRR